MQLRIPKQQLSSPELFIRRAGYGMIMDRRGGIKSFVRRLDRDLCPRFHIYLEDKNDEWALNLHLDQRATVYEGVAAHSGEYDGEVMEQERERIKHLLPPLH